MRSLSVSPLQDVHSDVGMEDLGGLKDDAMSCNADAQPHSLDILAAEDKGTSNPFYISATASSGLFF
jgi:hypothetical protein